MSDQQKRLVQISFRKQVSDGNYGTEAAEASLEWCVAPEEDSTADVAAAAEMLNQARDLVHGELLRSPSQRVRAAIDARTYKQPAISNARAGEDAS